MNKLMTIGGILALVAGAYFIIFSNPHIPLLDANRTLLAETQAQAICSGTTWFETQGLGDEQLAKECVEESAWSHEIDHAIVQDSWCSGIISAGYPIDQPTCSEILKSNRLWPTLDGPLAYSWNRKFPYPGKELGSQGTTDSGRTGGRTGITRDEGEE